jgi:hypothetical protein
LKKLGRKTDRRDASELSRRLWLGDLDRMASTYYPSDAEYGYRKLLRVRHQLVQMRQQAINSDTWITLLRGERFDLQRCLTTA